MLKKALLCLSVLMLSACASTTEKSLYEGTDAATIELKSSAANVLAIGSLTMKLTVDGSSIGFDPALAKVAPGEHEVEVSWEVNEFDQNTGTLKLLGSGREHLTVDAKPNRSYAIVVQRGKPNRRNAVDFFIREN